MGECCQIYYRIIKYIVHIHVIKYVTRAMHYINTIPPDFILKHITVNRDGIIWPKLGMSAKKLELCFVSSYFRHNNV